MSFTRLLHARCSRPMAPEEQELCYKAQGRAFAQERGVPVAELLQGPCSRDQLTEPTEPRWVAKPNRGCTSRGVIVAQRTGDGQYWNQMGQNVEGWDDVRSWELWVQWMRWAQETARTSGATFPDEWILESRIGSGPGLPTEYGVYCVHGEPSFIRQVELNGHRPGRESRVCNWHPNGNPAGTVLISSRQEASLELRHRTELLDYAATLATDWPGPFVRVDFLEGDEGPVFSELTPRPAGGRIRLVPEWDRRMGEAWKKGEPTLATR